MDVDYETQLQEDIRNLPPPRDFKGHPEVPFALTPDDLAVLRPNCENKTLDHYTYGRRVAAQRVLREADEAVAKTAFDYFNALETYKPAEVSLALWNRMRDEAMEADAARAWAKRVGSP